MTALPKPTQDWSEDCQTGRDYADRLIDYVKSSGDLPAFSAALQSGNGGIRAGLHARLLERVA